MISLANIQNAADMIRPFVLKTPLIYSPTFSSMTGLDIYLKLENLQKTGSFKIRGAANKILANPDRVKAGGVVAASAGNHAQGVALAARHAGVPATIVMPQWASISKQEATQNYGGNVIIHGESIGESLDRARQLAAEGRMFIHPFDDADIIAGQGTIGLEILEDLSDVDALVVPVGGGGLVSGIALAAKSINPGIKIIGVQAAACPSISESLKYNEIRKVALSSSIADGISIRQTGTINFEMIKKYVDNIVLVEEEQIAAAVLMLLERKKILAEGAGAVSLAAVMNGGIRLPEKGRVVLLVSGGNVDSPLLGRIINRGLMEHGRVLRLRVLLEDRPGSLAALLSLLAGLKVNVLNIFHERYDKDLPLYVSRVQMEVETRNSAHIEEVLAKLKNEGYALS